MRGSHDRTGRQRTEVAATVTRRAVRFSAWSGVAASRICDMTGSWSCDHEESKNYELNPPRGVFPGV